VVKQKNVKNLYNWCKNLLGELHFTGLYKTVVEIVTHSVIATHSLHNIGDLI